MYSSHYIGTCNSPQRLHKHCLTYRSHWLTCCIRRCLYWKRVSKQIEMCMCFSIKTSNIDFDNILIYIFQNYVHTFWLLNTFKLNQFDSCVHLYIC